VFCVSGLELYNIKLEEKVAISAKLYKLIELLIKVV
jgi:hypothetical protein